MTDRTLATPVDLDALDFGKLAAPDDASRGLVPVIAQDARSGEVLMIAFADRSALEASLESGQMHFWSRSRAELWRKGETSGNTLAVESLHTDCDGDAVLARVVPAGPACHTGERTCFGEVTEAATGSSDGVAERGAPAGDAGNAASGVPAPDALTRLDATLAARAADRPEGSYTVKLLDDENLRLKKLGEEAAELVTALAKGEKERAVEEAADLVYHTVVGLRAEGIGVEALLAELERRAG